MDKELRDRWIAALRSGNYKQTANVLKDDKGFCCLGVLLETREGPDIWGPPVTVPNFDFGYQPKNTEHADARMLTCRYLRVINLEERIADELSRMNDDGVSFRAIAAYIKANVR